MEQVMNKKLVHMWINVTSCDLMERWLVRMGAKHYICCLEDAYLNVRMQTAEIFTKKKIQQILTKRNLVKLHSNRRNGF